MILLEVAVLLTVGKYLFLVCLYVFVLAVFRGMMRQLGADVGATDRPGVEPALPRVSSQRGLAASASQPAAVQVPSGPGEPSRELEHRVGPRLVVVEAFEGDPAPGSELPLTAAVTIGRNQENAIALKDGYTSGRHALICLREGRRMLLDRGSTNGTFVNGQRVDSEVELRDGDRIALGRTVLEYRAS
ncbi:unnamed protein product [marine sediment metagenome]|uniref:FHA domain-containing protein n=1 Tax=marine sediment metagenome TaxID=412755 RepID=X0WIS6_9ZZZZ